MPAEAFFDTNVLLYAFAAGDPRGDTAEALLAGGGRTSVQTFNEFTNVSRKKLGLDWNTIGARISIIRDLLGAPAPLTEAAHQTARRLARAHSLGFYDALIVAAAQECGAKVLFSEDMQDGQRFSSVTVRNPFA